mgnify:CR=1 FL=1
MKASVRISFGAAEVAATLPDTPATWPADEARRWLDEQFIAYDCEPLRPLGKVLTADKLVVLARAIGPRTFADDEALRTAYARAAVAALGRDDVHIDAEAGQVHC